MATKKSAAPTKSDILAQISKDTELSKKQVSAVFESLNGIIKKSLKGAGLFTMPGFFTPTEAFTALEAGADVLKLFPAELAGPGAVKAIPHPFYGTKTDRSDSTQALRCVLSERIKLGV
jgi:hypothetical protein